MEENTQQSQQDPVDQPPHVDSPTEGEHLTSADPGHPAGETDPEGGVPARAHEHPEDIGETTPDKESSP
jgi:hypothetical protein